MPAQPTIWIAHPQRLPRGGDALLALLTREEEDRRLRFQQPEDRLRFATARALARLVLARELACGPLEIRIGLEATGRPRVEAPAPAPTFSISHSGALVAVAVAGAAGQAIGIDVESGARIAPQDLEGMIATVCAPAEAARLRATAQADRLHRFLALWTLKEAYLKATGEGLAADPRHVAFERETEGRPALMGAPPAWDFFLLPEFEGHVLALAAHDAPAPLRPRVQDGDVLLAGLAAKQC